MDFSKISERLIQKYGAENVEYLGAGSDSAAFRVNNQVFRFTRQAAQLYQREADICHFLSPFISVKIPDIAIVQDDDCCYAAHTMIVGKKWSWHKFMFQPQRQRNLAVSAAKFFAQLHSVDVATARREVPDIDGIAYVDLDMARDFMKACVPGWLLRFFERHYQRIVSDPRTTGDVAIVHLGFKGPNSVCNDDGSLYGVYDFGNCGIYERSREFVPVLTGGNGALYRAVCREYARLTGVKIDTCRVRDLAELEFMLGKRWHVQDGVARMPGIDFFHRRFASAVLHFAHLPRYVLRPLLCVYLARYARRHMN